MRFETGQQMRIDQRMKLAPRMIQSMEILQLGTQALEERIEQELGSNPTLELAEVGADRQELLEQRKQTERDAREGERELVVEGDAQHTSQADDFERLENFASDYGESWDTVGEQGRDEGTKADSSWSPDRYRASGPRASSSAGERDGKLDAMANTAARGASLAEQLHDQWRFVDVPKAIADLGDQLIDLIDDDGYLRLAMDPMLKQLPPGTDARQVEAAIDALQQNLEPAGLAARDLRECLLLQIQARLEQVDDIADDADEAERMIQQLESQQRILRHHHKDLEMNRLPKIAKETGLSIEQINEAVAHLRHYQPHPGRSLVTDRPSAVYPDAFVEYDPQEDRYVAVLTQDRLPALQLNRQYTSMAKDKQYDKRTRDFIGNNLRTGRWLIDAIAQRHNTLMRVINVVIDAQREFFDFGPAHLKPLPMTQVAEQLGVHVATVSRAVSDKYIQAPRGIYPLRMFFSGGTETESGQSMSWTAVQAKLQQVIDEEDKSKPLSDDQLVEKLKAHGIDIARRTVAKYRKQLNIASARQRREY